MSEPTVSVIIPARNEGGAIGRVVADVCSRLPLAEVIVVNDGSDDATAAEARAAGARVIDHPYSKGNGAAIKAGARAAQGDWLVFMDGDGQHDPADIDTLLQPLRDGADMAIGARSAESQAAIWRHAANALYNYLASWVVGHRIPDLTSGFRAVRAARFREFIYLLPNGFSYPTTITMAFFRAGYTVIYRPITAARREGKSHVNLFRDGVKFLLIIFRVCTLYSPLKLFFPLALAHGIIGVGYYGYTYATMGRFTNMSALLFSSAIIIFLIGLISEQITALLYSHEDRH